MNTVTGTFRGSPTIVTWFPDGTVDGPEAFLDALDDLFALPAVDLSSLVLVEFPRRDDVEHAGMLIESLFDKVADTDFQTDWELDLMPPTLQDAAAVNIGKHKGPGPHPGTGTPQDVHGHGAGLLAPNQGEGAAGGQPVETLLINPDGSHPHVTMDGIENMTQLKDGKRSSIARWTKTIRERVQETLDLYGITNESMDRNLATVFESAMQRYADHPELFESDQFYKEWHEALFEIARTHNLDFDDVIAAASSISPGLDAELNLQFAEELAVVVADNPVLTLDQRNAIATELQGNAYMIRNPVWTENHVLPKGVEIGDPKPPPPEGSSRLAIAAQLDKAAHLLRTTEGVKLLQLDGESAARAVHWLRQQEKGAGFQTKTWTNWAMAIDVLRPDRSLTANEALRGIKTRSFYNNILDPHNDFGRDDVTVDFHTINFVTFGLGSDANTHIQGTPSLGGVGLGIRPAVADAVRRVDTGSLNLHGSRVQEILWAEWRRGQGPKGSNTWTSYDGTVHNLADISSDPRKK